VLLDQCCLHLVKWSIPYAHVVVFGKNIFSQLFVQNVAFFYETYPKSSIPKQKIKEARIRWAFYQKLLKNTGGGW